MTARLPRLASRMWSAAARADVHAEHGNFVAMDRARRWLALWSAAVKLETAPLFKRCTCCGRTYSLAAWRHLPLVGEQGHLTLRNCRVCVSTLAVASALEAA